MSELLQPVDEQVAKWARAIASGDYRHRPIPGLTDGDYTYPSEPQREGPKQVAKAEAAQMGGYGGTK